MLPASMPRSAVCFLLAILALSGCSYGEKGPQSSSVTASLRPGEKIFNQRCGGCHTFDQAGTEGSAVKANSREYKDGPNFNVRKEQYDAVLYAIRNGGFSSGPMPQNIVVGHDAEVVACFVATYSGKQAVQPPSPQAQPTSSSNQGDCREQLASK
jgi:mono/diheme cytochrome c family protein